MIITDTSVSWHFPEYYHELFDYYTIKMNFILSIMAMKSIFPRLKDVMCSMFNIILCNKYFKDCSAMSKGWKSHFVD